MTLPHHKRKQHQQQRKQVQNQKQQQQRKNKETPTERKERKKLEKEEKEEIARDFLENCDDVDISWLVNHYGGNNNNNKNSDEEEEDDDGEESNEENNDSSADELDKELEDIRRGILDTLHGGESEEEEEVKEDCLNGMFAALGKSKPKPSPTATPPIKNGKNNNKDKKKSKQQPKQQQQQQHSSVTERQSFIAQIIFCLIETVETNEMTALPPLERYEQKMIYQLSKSFKVDVVKAGGGSKGFLMLQPSPSSILPPPMALREVILSMGGDVSFLGKSGQETSWQQIQRQFYEGEKKKNKKDVKMRDFENDYFDDSDDDISSTSEEGEEGGGGGGAKGKKKREKLRMKKEEKRKAGGKNKKKKNGSNNNNNNDDSSSDSDDDDDDDEDWSGIDSDEDMSRGERRKFNKKRIARQKRALKKLWETAENERNRVANANRKRKDATEKMKPKKMRGEGGEGGGGSGSRRRADFLKPVVFSSAGFHNGDINEGEGGVVPPLSASNNNENSGEEETERGGGAAMPTISPSISVRSHHVLDHSSFGHFEAHTKGFGSKMLQKMGFAGRLGAKRTGIEMPLAAVMRPKRLGLGAGGDDNNTAE